MWIRRAALAAAVSIVLAAGPAFAQQRGAAAGMLDALDYYEIQNLIARYAHGFDSGAEQGYMWADVFTPDGVFMDGSGREYRGRDAIAQFGSGGPNSRKGPTSVGHFITNVLIDPTPTGARARSYVMIGGGGGRGRGAAPTAGPPPAPSFGMGGTYFDDLVKTSAGWRIRERVLVRPGTTPDAVKAATMPSTAPATVVPPHADASGAMPGAIRLTADDYAQIVRTQLTDDGVVTNVMVTPVSNGAVAKAYKMRVTTADGQTTIGPEGIYFTFFAKSGDRWRPVDGHYMAAGSPVPDAARPYASIPATVTPPPVPPFAGPSLTALAADDYAAIGQLYARTAFAEDNGEPHHFVYNVRVEKTAAGATSQAHVIVLTLGGQGRQIAVSAIGEYRDELVKTAAGWQIRSRTFAPR